MTTENFGKVGVLYGGHSAERDISLKSGQGVLAALQRQGIDAHGFDTGRASLSALAAENFARVFIALHGRFGEDGTVQGALELLRIPYTGSGVTACAVAMDKVLTKRIWQSHGLPTPTYQVLTADSNLDAVAATMPLPSIVKPSHEGSSLGLSKITDATQWPAALQLATQFDQQALAEAFIVGRELTVAILGDERNARALPIIDIIAPNGNYDYVHKYLTNDTRYVCPAELSTALTTQIQDLALAAYRAIGCSGWGRVDVMLRAADNAPFLLEVNAAPGMTDHSLVPMAANAVGLSYDALVLEILRSASLKIKGVA